MVVFIIYFYIKIVYKYIISKIYNRFQLPDKNNTLSKTLRKDKDMLIKSSKNDENLGLVYIAESYDTPGSVTNMKANNTAGVFYVTFDTYLQDFDVLNRNKRYYDGDNVWGCIKNDMRIQSLLQSNGWFGEFEHPVPMTVSEKLSPERIKNVPPEKRAFKIMNPRIEGNKLAATIQSAQGEVGEGFGKEVVAGWIAQFSARAIAVMTNRNGKPYVMMKQLITYDSPWFPSHEVAHQTSSPKATFKPFIESVKSGLNDVKTAVEAAVIPLKEILTNIGHSDPSTQLILESFDLNESNLIGITEDRKHTIIKDENNIIYANVKPETVKKINDFYESFNI